MSPSLRRLDVKSRKSTSFFHFRSNNDGYKAHPRKELQPITACYFFLLEQKYFCFLTNKIKKLWALSLSISYESSCIDLGENKGILDCGKRVKRFLEWKLLEALMMRWGSHETPFSNIVLFPVTHPWPFQKFYRTIWQVLYMFQHTDSAACEVILLAQ